MNKNTKAPVRAAMLTVLLGVSSASALAAEHDSSHASTARVASDAFNKTDALLRDLWLGHAFWTRAVAAETLSGNTTAAEAAEQAAVANAKQISASLEPFYGKPATDKAFSLLAGHYGAVKQYVAATKARKPSDQDTAKKAMIANAEQIAQFFSSANPHLPVDALRAMLFAHGAHHIQQIEQLSRKEYADEAKTWEEMKNHMYSIADAFTAGLAAQFPEKFSGTSNSAR